MISLLRTEEAAHRLGCTAEQLIEWAEAGRVTSYRIGSRRRFDPTDLEVAPERIDEAEPEEASDAPRVADIVSHLAAEAGLRPDEPAVYAIEAGPNGPVKIGFVRTLGMLPRRLRALQAGCPSEIRPLALLPGGLEVESACHRTLEAYRIRGEWFEREATLRWLGRGEAP